MASLVLAPLTVSVKAEPDVATVRRATREFLNQAGFVGTALEEVVLVAVELATNLVRHAFGGGELTLRELALERGAVIEIESRDAGPGIDDVEHALQDGTSTVGGLGGGLGTIKALVDEFSIVSLPTGTLITVRRRRAGP